MQSDERRAMGTRSGVTYPSVVAVVATTPQTVLDDTYRAMVMAGIIQH